MSVARRRLLFIAPLMPSTRGNGLAMRTGFFLRTYASVFEVDLAVIPLVSAAASSDGFARSHASRMLVLPRPDRSTQFSLIAAMPDPAAQVAAFRTFGQPSLAAFMRDSIEQSLSQWTAGRSYDVVHVSRLYLASLVAPWLSRALKDRPRLVLDCDEDDAATHHRIAALDRRNGELLRAAWADAEADAFARLRDETLPRFDLVFAASPAEAKAMSGSARRAVAIPNVVPAPSRPPARRTRQAPTIVFVASMGYAPNDDAARWVLSHLWPRLHRLLGCEARFLLIGSNPSDRLVRHARRAGVEITGTVPDVGSYYRRADLAIIPLRAGGGTRIKLMEAAAHDIPVVSTTIGAEGTAFRDNHEVMIGDSAARLVQHCMRLLRRPAEARRLARRARHRLKLMYDGRQWSRTVLHWIDHAGDATG